jgi:hypothetical protein
MKRPLLLAGLLSAALIVVVLAKWKLDQAIKEKKFESAPESVQGSQTETSSSPNTIDIGVQQEARLDSSAPVHQAAGASKIDVMAALMSARQMFKSKAEATQEVQGNPHATPSSLIRAAETLGTLTSLEKSNPAYKPEFQSFYLDCIKDADVLTVTRVQCLENYVKSKELGPEDVEKLLTDVDPTVRQLYRETTR